ncbi:tail protein X [Sphingomonas sp. PL-96]|jgi:phage tail protein X|uniref:tail protein X n=1 Tax=Sphingomonas sp. PL-96 TaxID=2887201 RepID=UPI001E3513D1|nr:tail protein X [Sphingomonas sp. PL-96]MCC2976252.1 tail protein X [Sphingomonas sp. PL-96]
MATATAFAGEPLDALVWRATGGGSAAVDQVLALNPGVAAIGTALPEGTVVTLPETSTSSPQIELVQLWD